MRPNFNAGTFLQSYGSLVSLGATFGVDQHCLNTAGGNLQSCLPDILSIDGCCGEECWLILHSEQVRSLEAYCPSIPHRRRYLHLTQLSTAALHLQFRAYRDSGCIIKLLVGACAMSQAGISMDPLLGPL
jgi:hypothetical protein